MSELRMYSVRDVVSAVYGRPFFSTNNATATRSLQMEVNNPDLQSVLHTNPDDFELYFLGAFEDSDCSFDLLERPDFLCRCSSLVLSADVISAANRAGTLEDQ